MRVIFKGTEYTVLCAFHKISGRTIVYYPLYKQFDFMKELSIIQNDVFYIVTGSQTFKKMEDSSDWYRISDKDSKDSITEFYLKHVDGAVS